MGLQIALIVLGVVLILAVYLVSIWRERVRTNSSGAEPNDIQMIDRLDGDSNRHQSTAEMGHREGKSAEIMHQTESAKDLTGIEPVSYSDGFYSLQIAQHDDLEWSNAASLENLTDNSAEVDEKLHQSIEVDLAAEQGRERQRHKHQPDVDRAAAAADTDTTRDKQATIQYERQAQSNDASTGQTSPATVVGARRAYNYPNIDGFERVCQIDYWARLHSDHDIGREAVLAQFREARATLTKHNRLLGLKLPEKRWCDLEQESEDARFGDIIVTLQLADQKGPVNETELEQFLKLIGYLAEGTNRNFALMAPLENALQQARTISDFIRCYDYVFTVMVKPRQTDYLDGAAINLYATQLGLERSANNYFVRNKSMSNKVCLYSLANMSDSGEFDFDELSDFTTSGVIFFTKPAVNRSPVAVFSEMVDAAKVFAGRIKGEVVDLDNKELSQEYINQIRSSIAQVTRDMETYGMASGSDEAVRIFL